ncbi:hypothetical protein TcBrA4_0041070 [Trypanosoma cruzi]|nr:hypothetical protein TcBrA4_0041070 [Trypanosoma cruzi]
MPPATHSPGSPATPAFLSLQLEEDEEQSARGAPTLVDRWGKLTHGADGVLLASFLSRANSTSPTQTRRNSPGRIAATLQCLNRLNSTGCIIARHSITLHPRPGLTVEVPKENKEELCVELLTLMQQKSDGKKTARGSGELLLRVAISWRGEQCQSYWIGEGGGGRSRGLQRTRVRQTHPAPIRHTSAQLSSPGNI